MATSQRLSRGFHRLAFFLAAIPLLIGGAASLYHAYADADVGDVVNQVLVCVHDYLDKQTSQSAEGKNWAALFAPDDQRIDLKETGCRDWGQRVTYGEVRRPPDFNWYSSFGNSLLLYLTITLAVSLAVYGIVRAIGWVIGGFAAS